MTVCLAQCQRFPSSGLDSILIGFYADDEVQMLKEIATYVAFYYEICVPQT